jgi:hypothetical protein
LVNEPEPPHRRPSFCFDADQYTIVRDQWSIYFKVGRYAPVHDFGWGLIGFAAAYPNQSPAALHLTGLRGIPIDLW